MSLYLKHRPTDWSEVIGQDVAVSKLKSKLEANDLPNVILLFGPTGTGKTTIARILSGKLGVKPVDTNPNYVERNCADCRSIDDVREIGSEMGLAGFGKDRRKVYVLDEVIQLPEMTQKAMLKMLEDTPKHVYFFLCTTDKAKLLDTLVGRCYPVQLKALTTADLTKIIAHVMYRELAENGGKAFDKPISRIPELAEGSARMALQLLETVLTQEGEAAQLAALESTAAETLGYQVAQALVYLKGWSTVEKVLVNLVQEPEAVRRVILKYCESIVLNPKSDFRMKATAMKIGSKFMHDYKESGKFGLLDSCWKACN